MTMLGAQERAALLPTSGEDLPPNNNEGARSSNRSEYRRLNVQLALSLAVIVGTVVLLGSSQWGPSSSSSSTSESAETHLARYEGLAVEDGFEADIVVTNGYGSPPEGSKLYPWLEGQVVVEPHKESTLEVKFDADVYGDDLKFAWSIQAPGGTGEASTFSGSKITYRFESLGRYEVKAYAMDSKNEDGPFLGSVSISARALYVKREIRDLTEPDRKIFLDAAVTMWTIDTDTGKKIYGDNFVGMDTFILSHADEATGDVKCDRWHEGTGFLTHHLALADSFETSLRAIDRRATTPYWDFTIEGQQIEDAGGGPDMLADISPALTAKWFGSVDEESHVRDSRWAHLPSVTVNDVSDSTMAALSNTVVHNSYGIIRAPWNNAPDKELIRHMADVCGQVPENKAIPTCNTHFNVMSLTTFADFQLEIAGYGHGTMHVNTGGVFGKCTTAIPDLYAKYPKEMASKWTMSKLADAVNSNPEYTGDTVNWKDEEEFTMRDMMKRYVNLEYFHIFRTLWRSQTCAMDGLPKALQCPETCEDGEDCTCTCKGIDGEDNENFDWENLYPCMFASDTPKAIFDAVVTPDLKKDIVTMMCSTFVKEGENVESASPADPVFWMIHPILDRMITLKRLTEMNEGVSFGTMGTIFPFEDTSWLDYSYYSTNDYTCEGHGMFDAVISAPVPLPQKIIELGDDNGDGVLSNIEFYEVSDPTTGDGLDYIFADFKWDHCTSDMLPEDEALVVAPAPHGPASEGSAELAANSGSTSESVAPEENSSTDARRLSSSSKPMVYTEADFHILKTNVKPAGVDALKAESIRPSQPLKEYYSDVDAFRKGKGPRPGKDLTSSS